MQKLRNANTQTNAFKFAIYLQYYFECFLFKILLTLIIVQVVTFLITLIYAIHNLYYKLTEI